MQVFQKTHEKMFTLDIYCDMFISSRRETPQELERLYDEFYNHQASFSKQERFKVLLENLRGFYPSERCRGKKCVIGKACGNLDATVMFIAEAPGRNGAERTGIPIYGDPAGDNFERILFQATLGILTRKDLYITNTFLWNPTTMAGNNDRPTEEELRLALPFLKEQLDIVSPELVIVLGMTAYNTLGLISPVPLEGCSMKSMAGKVFNWHGKTLGVMYHPSPRVVGTHRTMEEMARDLRSILKGFAKNCRK